MLIGWKEELEIGNEMIDTQHRMLVLVLVLRKLDIAIKSSLEHKIIMGILLEIRRFTEFHFLSEENLMSELRYPDLLDHEKIHSNLLSQFNVFIAKINRKEEFAENILPVIHAASHVANEDLKIARYVGNSEFRPIAEECYGLYLK
jgi:hemerythrin